MSCYYTKAQQTISQRRVLIFQHISLQGIHYQHIQTHIMHIHTHGQAHTVKETEQVLLLLQVA